jgi:hypothetical protein
MKIARCGSRRNHGQMTTDLSPGSVVWDSDTKSVKLTAWFVRDFNATTQHDWYVSVTPHELALMLDAAASAIGGTAAASVAASMSQSLTSMLRLATECSVRRASPTEASQDDDDDEFGDEAD